MGSGVIVAYAIVCPALETALAGLVNIKDGDNRFFNNITAGPAYQYTWFNSVAAGEAASQGAAALVFSSRFDREITRRIDLLLEYRGQYTSRESGETFRHSVSTLSVDLT